MPLQVQTPKLRVSLGDECVLQCVRVRTSTAHCNTVPKVTDTATTTAAPRQVRGSSQAGAWRKELRQRRYTLDFIKLHQAADADHSSATQLCMSTNESNESSPGRLTPSTTALQSSMAALLTLVIPSHKKSLQGIHQLILCPRTKERRHD